MRFLIILVFFGLLTSFGNNEVDINVSETPIEIITDSIEEAEYKKPISLDNGKFFYNGDKILTFRLSGYTYYDNEVWDGVDGFVFWDRETESLWWPLVGKVISDPLLGESLQEMDDANWMDTDWKTIKEKYPTAQILKSDQDYERPNTWKKYNDVTDIINGFTLKD